MGEENQYLREAAEVALRKLETANVTINRVKKEKEDL